MLNYVPWKTRMKNVYKLTIVLLASMAVRAQDTATNSYTQTNLVSDISGMGTFTDPHLVNPWGLSRSAGSYWWASEIGRASCRERV